MTWKQLHTTNTKLIKGYMDYLIDETTQLTYDQRLKLVTEIGKLQLQINQIEGMLVEDYHKEIYTYTIKHTA